MRSWVEVADGSDFPLANLPYGVVRGDGGRTYPCVAIGDQVLDLGALAAAGLLDAHCWDGGSLDRFLAAGPEVWAAVRARLVALLVDTADRRDRQRVRPLLAARASVRPQLPFAVADFVDFYSSLDHATTVGRLFRPDTEPLLPNWRRLPVGYHGRAGSVVVTGTPVRRPWGQLLPPGSGEPVFAPTRQLDFEAEVGFVVGVPSDGRPLPPAALPDHVVGAVLVNDWSARDVQAFEYRPLGPFLGKAFATTLSPWLVPLAALEAARVEPPPQQPPPLPHLARAEPWGLDLALEVEVAGTIVARPPYAATYWTPDQQLAHLTSGGATVRTGDLYASGTVSGPGADQRGCLLELTAGGREPVTLADGTTRTYLDDGDEVVLRGSAPAAGGGRLGFGECRGRVVPAR